MDENLSQNTKTRFSSRRQASSAIGAKDIQQSQAQKRLSMLQQAAQQSVLDKQKADKQEERQIQASSANPAATLEAHKPVAQELLNPVIAEASKGKSQEEQAEIGKNTQRDVKDILTIASQGEEALTAFITQKRTDIEARKTNGENIPSSDALSLAFAAAIPTLLAGIMGGDERIALQGSADMVKNYKQIKGDERAAAMADDKFAIDEAQQEREALRLMQKDDQAQSNADRAHSLDLQKLNMEAAKANIKPLSVFDKQSGKEGAIEANAWFLKGGRQEGRSNIRSLNKALQLISDNADDNFAQLKARLPTWVRSFEFVDAENMRGQQLIETVIQQTLKQTLGAQFAQKEAEELFARAYNTGLPPEMRKEAVKELIGKTEAVFKVKDSYMEALMRGEPPLEALRAASVESDRIWKEGTEASTEEEENKKEPSANASKARARLFQRMKDR